MVKNTKEINSKKAVEGTLMKLFGFKRFPLTFGKNDREYDLELKLKCKDFNVFIYVANLETIEVHLQSKKHFLGNSELLQIIHCRYNFARLKQLVNRYKQLT